MARRWLRDDVEHGPSGMPRQAEPASYPLPTEQSALRVEPLQQAAEQKVMQQPSAAVSLGVAPGSGTQRSTRVSAKLGNAGTFTPSERTNYYRNTQRELEMDRPDDFSPSGDTLDYKRRLKDLEGDMPGPFTSRYEGQIQSILDSILNRPAFDVTKDANYKMLYDQAAERYMQQGNRAMRDTIGAANAATGGYGSTYAQMAGQQAYDNYLQGLNDQNAQLMQMAYGMYADDRANQYNQLGAVTGLDNTDYGRYRDTVGDYFTNRDYYANRYDNSFNRDYGQYRDLVSDWMNNRAYYADQANTAYGQDYGEFSDNRNMEYQMSRDEVADRDNALNAALRFAQAGMSVPSEFANMLGPDTVERLNGLAGQMAAQQAARGSGGGGRSGPKKKEEEKEEPLQKITAELFAQAVASRDPNVSAAVKASDGTAYDRFANRYVTGKGKNRKVHDDLDDIWNDMDEEEKQRYLRMYREL